MATIDLENTCAGMVLGEDIFGPQGQLLLRAGAVLNDKHLQMLRTHQIQNVVIGPDSSAALSQRLDPAAIDTCVQERFGISDAGHPLIEELRRLCHKRLTEQGGSNDK